MTRKPLYNAGLALVYITAVVLVINYGSKWATHHSQQTLLMPIGMLSLFVLSASIMGYIFLSQPIIMFLDGKRKEAISLFLQTLAIFAVATAVILLTSLFIFK